MTDTLSTTPQIDAEITTLAGTYTLQLTVTQRETGVEQYFSMQCLVEESITAGWMLLYERADQPGTSDAGLVVNPLVKKNITTAQEREFWDLYSASNQEPLQGTPIRIMRPIISLTSGTDPVTCLTSKELVNVNNATFQKTADFEDFFYTAPSTQAAIWIGTASRMMNRQVLINDNKVHTVNYSMMVGGGNYMGDAKRGNYGELAAWGSDVTRMNEAVVYDQTNGCFLHIVQYTDDIIPFAAQSPTAKFDVNNVNATIIAADWGRGSGSPMDAYDYLLMANGSNRYLAIANFNGAATDTNVGVGWYDITTSPGSAEATTIAAAMNGEYVLYDADVHGADAERYDRVIGYIGNDAANDGGTGLSPLSDTEVNVIEEKSPVILVSLLARQITIGSMSDAIDTLTVEELMEIEPGSVFDSEELRTATVDEISARITALFTAMTVGQLLEYANVSVSAEIAYILSDVHITDFFGALTFNPDTAAIEVDMYKLFGVGA